MTNTNPRKDPSQNFGLGLFVGTIAGIASYYLFNTPKGRELKAEIIEQFDRHKDHFKKDVEQFVKEHPLPQQLSQPESLPEPAEPLEQTATFISKLTAIFKSSSPETGSADIKVSGKKNVFTKGGKKLN